MKAKQRRVIPSFLALLLTVVFAVVAALPVFANDTTIQIGAGRNAAPIAENLELTTYRGVAVTGRFKAIDPDGDALTFEITAAPKKGAVTPTDGGEFVYAPTEGAKGKDSFTYVAVDANGGVSQSATVTVNLKKQSVKLTYADMAGDPAYYAALVLAEKGVFTGETLGGASFFRPEEDVTRGEFLAMCLSLTGARTLDGITRTGFSDDGSIPMWVKPYVSAALMSGVVSGYRDELGRPVFLPGEAITFSEAAVILNKALSVTDVTGTGAAAIDTSAVPAWAQRAAVNLTACNILPAGLAGNMDGHVTRADAAELFLAASEVLEARGTDTGGLFGWL
ncbi:MAG: S-layer homology domain-containing protein [Oscillospiraceae bacterium]|jgi:hypothetical protein|nr:S-layer homology domain-containing protein [Oscillospiraceae bacterium]